MRRVTNGSPRLGAGSNCKLCVCGGVLKGGRVWSCIKIWNGYVPTLVGTNHLKTNTSIAGYYFRGYTCLRFSLIKHVQQTFIPTD